MDCKKKVYFCTDKHFKNDNNFTRLFESQRQHRNVNDYAWYIGAEELHPLISVIHYDELEHCRHLLNNYDEYVQRMYYKNL